MSAGADHNRHRILAAAAELLADGGRAAVSTRAVCARAGVQSPTIYRLFGDMDGLLDAVAAREFAAYVAGKAARERGDDPVDDLRRGWDLHVEFGLTHPAVYALTYGDPSRSAAPAAVAGLEILAGHVRRIAEAGRLRVPQARAAQLLHAAGNGTVLALIATPPEHRDPGLSALAREAVLAAVTVDGRDAPAPGPVAAALALQAGLPDVDALTPSERGLMTEWLDRIAVT